MARAAGRGGGEPGDRADTGIFDDDEYFDVVVEYAKGGVEDILVRFTVTNHGPEARLELLPTAWFRNTWRWWEKRPEDAASALSLRGRAAQAAHRGKADDPDGPFPHAMG